MNKITYRSFTFFNYQMNATKNTTGAEYIALDFFDRFHTESINVYYDKDEFTKLWNYTNQLSQRLDGYYSYQNIFGLRVEREDSLLSDDEFWDLDNCEISKKFPLTFITLLQFKNNDSSLYSFCDKKGSKNEEFTPSKLCREIEKILKELLKDRGYAICYYTVDKNDIIVATKLNSYKVAFDCINLLHCTIRQILYSYTILLLSDRLLENDEILNQLKSDEKIDSICIKAVHNNEEYMDFEKRSKMFFDKLTIKLFDSLESDSRIYNIFGSSDCRYIARKVPLRKLVEQFKHNGLLDKINSNFRKYFYFASTSLNQLISSDKGGEDELAGGANKEFNISERLSRKYSDLNDRIKHIINPGKNGYLYSVFLGYLQTFKQLIATITSMELVATNKTVLYSLSYYIFLLMDGLSNSINSVNDCLKVAETKSLYDSLQGISSTLNGTLRTDIQFFQVNNFNAITHYAPDKLKHLYNALAYLFTKLYMESNSENQKEKKYAFVVVPGLYNKIEVTSLDLNEKSHVDLHLINMPEMHLYKPATNCIVFSHEVSHYVGTSMRKREYRGKCVGRILLYILSDITFSCLLNNQNISHKLYKFIEEYIINDCYVEKQLEFLINDSVFFAEFEDYHSSKLIYSLGLWTVSKFNFILDIIMVFLANLEQKAKKKNELYALVCNYNKNAKENIYNSVMNYWKNSYGEICDSVFYCIGEAYSDICSVLSLKLSFDEYIDSFYNSGFIGLNNYEDTIDDNILIRIYIVRNSFIKAEKQFDKEINSSKWVEWKSFLESWKKDIQKDSPLFVCLNNYQYSLKSVSQKKYKKTILNPEKLDICDALDGTNDFYTKNIFVESEKTDWFFHNIKVIDLMIDYLVNCVVYFFDKAYPSDNKDKNNNAFLGQCQKMRNYYLKLKNFEDNPDIINELLLDYKTSIQSDFNKWNN